MKIIGEKAGITIREMDIPKIQATDKKIITIMRENHTLEEKNMRKKKVMKKIMMKKKRMMKRT